MNEASSKLLIFFILESDSGEIEVWSCMQENCEASIKVDSETQLLVESLGQHNCLTSLTMTLDKKYAVMEDHVFWRESGNNNY